MKSKLTKLIVLDVELSKKQCLHHNATASTPQTAATVSIIATKTTATKAKTTIKNLKRSQVQIMLWTWEGIGL